MLRSLALLLLVTMAASCGDSAAPVARTVDVDSLSPEDVRVAALAAVRDGGEIFHYAETGDGDPWRVEAWLDLDQVLARQDVNGRQRQVWAGERTAFVGGPGDVFNDALFTTDFEPPIASALPYLGRILSPNVEMTGITEATIEGRAAIAIEVRAKRYERSGYDEWTVYLDESFLPVRVDEDGAKSDVSYEFIERATLDAGFFSSDPLRAIARKPVDAVDEARAAGLNPYWIGESFEDLHLTVESGWTDDSEFEPYLHLAYGPEDGMLPVPCAHVYEYSAEDWERRAQRFDRDDREPQPGERVLGDVAAGSLRGRIFAGPDLMPGGPGAEPRVIDPQTGAEAPLEQPDLPDVLGDDGGGRRAVLEGDDIVIEVAANCGPRGSNIYRTDAGIRRLTEALHPYD